MKKARSVLTPTLTTFRDIKDVEREMNWLRRCVRYASRDFPPKEREDNRLRARRAFIFLAKQLRDELRAIEIPDHGLDDYHRGLLSELQKAYKATLDFVRRAPTPCDWSEKYFHILNRQLRGIQAIHQDVYDWVDHVNRERRRVISAEAAKRGGKATAEKYARPGLDNLIRGFLARREKMPVKAWASEYDVSIQTIYNRRKRVKSEAQ